MTPQVGFRVYGLDTLALYGTGKLVSSTRALEGSQELKCFTVGPSSTSSNYPVCDPACSRLANCSDP